MPQPTARNLRKKPMALVIQTFPVENGVIDTSTRPGDEDFEWFETEKYCTYYVEEARKWAAEDVAGYGDNVYLVIEVTDTKADPPVLGQVFVAPEKVKDGKDVPVEVITALKKAAGGLLKNSNLIFTPVPAKEAVKPKDGVKAKAKNKAAAAAIDKSGPRKGVRRVAKPKVKHEAEDIKPAGVALKDRLKAKAAEQAVLDSAVVSV